MFFGYLGAQWLAIIYMGLVSYCLSFRGNNQYNCKSVVCFNLLSHGGRLDDSSDGGGSGYSCCFGRGFALLASL